jgi:microcystin-dependent protein
MVKYFLNPFAISGDKTAVPNGTQVSGSVSYEEGFGPDYQKDILTDASAKPVPRPQSNQLYFDITENIQQYQQHGVPEFITTADHGGTPYGYDKYSMVRYDDGGGFKVYISKVDANDQLPTNTTNWKVVNLVSDNCPIGVMLDFAGTAVPADFLGCNGAAVNRTTYAALFAAIGVTWGPGDGSTTFNLPNFQRRVSVGSGGSATGVLGNTVGSVGGAETHTLTIGEMPAHDHPGSNVPSAVVAVQSGSGANPVQVGGATPGPVNIVSQGDGDPHSIVQSSAVVLKIIRYQ